MAVNYREGYARGSWGGVAHAVEGAPKDSGTALCGQSVSVGFQPWAPEVNGVFCGGNCKRCYRRWQEAK